MRIKRKQSRKTVNRNSIIDKSEELTVSISSPKSILRRRCRDDSAVLKNHINSKQKYLQQIII